MQMLPCMSGAVNHICHNGTRRRKFTGALSIIHCLSAHVRIYQNRIEHALYRIERIFWLYNKRRHQCIVLTTLFHTLCKELDCRTHFLSIRKINGSNRSDSLCRDISKIHFFAIGKRCENRNLAAGIKPQNIRIWIFLSISFLLRPCQHSLKGKPFCFHLRQYIIGRTIQNTSDRENIFLCKRGSKRPYDRDSPADTRLKKVAAIMRLCELNQFRSILLHKLLVGGTHTLSTRQGTLCKLIRRMFAAHCLTDNRNLCVIDNRIYIMNQHFLNRIAVKFSQIKHVLDMNLIPQPASDDILILFQHLIHAASYCTISQYCYLCHFLLTSCAFSLRITRHKSFPAEHFYMVYTTDLLHSRHHLGHIAFRIQNLYAE